MQTPFSHQRAFTGLVAAFGISAVGFGSFAPFLVLWGHRDAGLTGSVAGLLFVAQAVGEITGGLAGGLLADRFGARLILLISTIGMAIGYGSLAWVGAPAPAIGLIFVAGLFEAAYHPTAFALVADLKAEEDRTQAYGVMRAAGNLGTILGPLAGAAVVAGASLSDVFLVTGGLLVIAGVLAYLSLPRAGSTVDLAEEAEELQDAIPGLLAIGRDRRLGLLVLGGALLAITLAWWEADGLVVIGSQRTFTTSTFSIMLALSAAITVCLQIPITRWTRQVRVSRLLGGGAALQALGLGVLVFASSGLALVIAAVILLSVGDMLYGPNLSALVSRIAPKGRGATYQAAMSTTADVGQALGPMSGLGLSAQVGARALWIAALPIGLIAATAVARANRAARSGTIPADVTGV